MAGTGLIQKLKANKLRLPIWLGQLVSYIPYSYRPIVGKVYRERLQDIASYNCMSIAQRQSFIYTRMKSIVDYAFNNIKFYNDYYTKQDFSPDQLKSFDDISRIPIVDKNILIEYDLNDRSNIQESKFLANTGGSTGQTFSFYVQPSSIGNEWAHIHTMWSFLGFKPSDLKLYIAGRSVVQNGVDYEFARHTLSVDMYKPFSETAPILKQKLKKHPCFYLHGYPSTLSEFAEYCKTDKELLALLKPRLKGAFLSSEYPFPIYRDLIEQVFDIPSQSFYGHTERCVMAYETEEKFKYIPFQTYGYAEAYNTHNGHYDLLGTTYYNYASPLIRYNTKDIIDNPISEGGILGSFHIYEGRSGQYVLDKNGKKISLTGLIMGRHHTLFDVCSHIQISQEKAGTAMIYYVPKTGCQIQNPDSLFDSSNISIDFIFTQLTEPIRTVSGKVNLLVKEYV